MLYIVDYQVFSDVSNECSFCIFRDQQSKKNIFLHRTPKLQAILYVAVGQVFF